MNGDRIDRVSRREAVQWSLGAAAGLMLMGRRGRAAESKLAKAAVQYTDDGKVAGKDCDDCSQFIAGKSPTDAGTCKIVEGAISPHGHCIAFTPKPKA